MKNERECKVIQDLLPNYVEKLTNEETNKYIEEHLENCNECKTIYENMRENMNLQTEKTDKREIKYFKKYRNKLRILKVILLIILIVFSINTARKMIIISNLSNKTKTYQEHTNYHKKIYSLDKGNYLKTEIFVLGNKNKIIQTKVTDDGMTVQTMYATKKEDDRYSVNIYTEKNNIKTAQLNKTIGMIVDSQDGLYTENLWHLVLYSIPTTIKETTFSGKDCYYISNFESPYSYCSEGMYIDKETGLPISTMAYEIENFDGTVVRGPAYEYEYHFNTVTEKNFIEPDISEYIIQE